ncbi:MAG: hypothetical protein HY481_01825 [Candidatus Vogelbacteria bacterium]|nr:hypothetical protein [Candidatus Vogelbacteria bacterium]
MSKITLFGFIAAIIAGIAYFNWPTTVADPKLAAFAQCLKEKNVVMYGADWCPHCQEEKAAFGDAFQFIPYVECPEEPKRCLAAGIENYPTWIFPASPARLAASLAEARRGALAKRAGGSDGRKFVGRQGLERLAGISGCPFP